jgi:predicted PurR-regulated permease PerM
VIDIGVLIYGYLQASAFGTLVGATAIIPYIIYFLITVAYAVKRRTTDTIPVPVIRAGPRSSTVS